MGADTFSMPPMDAYFDSGQEIPSVVINVPSDFHLRMSPSTTIRVFPRPRGIPAEPIYIYNKKNVRVTGGNLIGDRLLLPPSNDSSNSLFTIRGSRNVRVNGVKMSLASSTGMTINSILFQGQEGFIKSRDIEIRNCFFNSNRNNNFSITDGDSILIENSRSRLAGNDMRGRFGLSNGRAPRIGIVVEPQIGQEISNITIRNNVIEQTSSGGNGNSILASGGTNFLIEGGGRNCSR